jgi:hypothetical protein
MKIIILFRANDDDEEDFMNDDPAFDDADQENKENAVELGMKKILFLISIHNSLFSLR